MARSGLPSHFAKMGFKKGWKAYKASRGGSRSSGTKKHHSKKVHHPVYLSGDFSAPAMVRAPIKKLSSITPEKIFSPIIDLGLLIVGMVLAAGLKKVSPIKNPHLMNGAQTVAGVGGSLMTRNRFVKMPLLGVALQSTISEAKILFPKMVPLAGDDEVIYLPAGEVDYEQLQYVQGEDMRGEEEIEGEEIRGENMRGEYEEITGENSLLEMV
jgi:hypothetical protein